MLQLQPSLVTMVRATASSTQKQFCNIVRCDSRKVAEAAELEAVLAAVDRCPPHQQQMYYMPQLPVNRSRVVSIHRIQNWCDMLPTLQQTPA